MPASGAVELRCDTLLQYSGITGTVRNGSVARDRMTMGVSACRVV
jgi:hypothetical protein